MQAYDWPGNVRELKNVIERCLLLNTTPSQCLGTTIVRTNTRAQTEVSSDDLSLEEVEKRHIINVLNAENGNKSAAARRLGVSRKTLERKVHAWEAEV